MATGIAMVLLYTAPAFNKDSCNLKTTRHDEKKRS